MWGVAPFPVAVTTGMITFLVGDPCKPLFATVPYCGTFTLCWDVLRLNLTPKEYGRILDTKQKHTIEASGREATVSFRQGEKSKRKTRRKINHFAGNIWKYLMLITD